MQAEQLDYASPQTRRPINRPVKRSFGQWMILFMTWGVGLAVWAVYLVIVFYLVLRLL